MALNSGINTAALGAGFVYSDGSGLLSVGSAGSSIKVTKFTASGTWTKDAQCQSVTVICWNGGSGGGSGRQGATTAAGGGGGGTNGAVLIMGGLASAFNATETVTIGAGGAGGLTKASATSDGNPGVTGGNSSLGSILVINPDNAAGGGGGGGTTTISIFNNYGQMWNLLYSTGASFTPNNGSLVRGSNAAPGDQTSLSLSNVSFAGNALYLPTMGGPASGADSGVVRQAGNAAGITAMGGFATFTAAGGTGGIASGTINGGAGNNAISTTGGRYVAATGGGGGGGQNGAAVAGIGGAGGIPGAGGGGGGGSLNGTTSGAGGAGGRGELWVIELLS